jgi:CubicO group peptidase (beta-lactamase class C family)
MGLVSTVSDLAVFVRAVGNRARLNRSPDSALPAHGDDWGVTWQRGDDNTTSSKHDGTAVFFGHGGAVPGYLSFAWRDPKNDITIVWFGSSTLSVDRSASGRFERILERALFDLALDQTRGDMENARHVSK